MAEPVGEPETVNSVIRDVENAWNRLLTAVDSVPPERSNEPNVCGTWSAMIVIGHVAFWNGFEAIRLREEHSLGEVDWQALNDANANDNRNRTFESIRTELVASHETLMSVIVKLGTLKPKEIRELVYDHYVEHAAELEKWVADIGA